MVSAVPRPWVVLWALGALLGFGLSIWWAVDAFSADDCTRFVARTDRGKLALGLTALAVPAGAWASTRISRSLFASGAGQGIYLAGVAVLLGAAAVIVSSVDLYSQPVIGWLLGDTAGCFR